MTDNDKLTDAFNEYEKLLKIAEEKDYKKGWVYYQLKEKYGEEITNEVYGNNEVDDDTWTDLAMDRYGD
jgi:hypothetical protein